MTLAVSLGRKSGNAVAKLVSRFNVLGGLAIARKHGDGLKSKYAVAERERILAQARRSPDPEQDGTASWSLMTLRRALRYAPDGLPKVRTYTIRAVLQDAGFVGRVHIVGARPVKSCGNAKVAR